MSGDAVIAERLSRFRDMMLDSDHDFFTLTREEALAITEPAEPVPPNPQETDS